MPTYDYNCTSCGHTQEGFQKIQDSPLTDCPQCHTPTFQKKPSAGLGISKGGDASPSTGCGSCCPCGKK